jgi:hypothetical protein
MYSVVAARNYESADRKRDSIITRPTRNSHALSTDSPFAGPNDLPVWQSVLL